MTRKTKRVLVIVGVIVAVVVAVGFAVRNMFSDIFGGVATNGFHEILRGVLKTKNQA